MKMTFIGANHEVTGSCTYIEACGKRFLVDFGMEQGFDEFENVQIPCNPSQIDFVLLTHAHIDHSGFCRCCMQAVSAARFTLLSLLRTYAI